MAMSMDAVANLSPREQAIEVIFNALNEAQDTKQGELPDFYEQATSLVEELERRVIGYDTAGHFVFGSELDEKPRVRVKALSRAA